MVKLDELTVEMQKELAELERARTMPIAFDEDCPEVTPEIAVRFRRVNPTRRTGDGRRT